MTTFPRWLAAGDNSYNSAPEGRGWLATGDNSYNSAPWRGAAATRARDTGFFHRTKICCRRAIRNFQRTKNFSADAAICTAGFFSLLLQ